MSNASVGRMMPVLVCDSARAKRAVSFHYVAPRSATPDLPPGGTTSEQRERWADDSRLGMLFCASEASSVLPLGGAQICHQGAPLASNESAGQMKPALVCDSVQAKRAVSVASDSEPSLMCLLC